MAPEKYKHHNGQVFCTCFGGYININIFKKSFNSCKCMLLLFVQKSEIFPKNATKSKLYEFARFKTKYWLNVTTLSAPISVHECLVWGDKLWWFARELWLTCVWSEIMESKIAHLQNCATAKRHNCWHCRFSFWFCLRFEVKCAFVVSRGLFVDVQRALWKIDVWKEIVFLVNFGRWDLSCSSEGGSIHTLYTREWKEPIYCDIFGSRARLFKPLFEIESIEVLTDYMYGKSSLCLPHNNLNINGGFILWLNQKKTYSKTSNQVFLPYYDIVSDFVFRNTRQ